MTQAEHIYCEYCGQEFGYFQQAKKSTHKMRCSRKRYLGGELEISASDDATELLGVD